MNTEQHAAKTLFALGLLGLGILALVYSCSGLVWQRVPAWLPWRDGFTFPSGVILAVAGAGLLFKPAVRWSVRILLPYLLIWLLLRITFPLTAPLTAVNWETAGEVGVLVAGAWVLFARFADLGAGSKLHFAAGVNAIRTARILFALSLLAFGLSHFAYLSYTAALVPAWLAFRTGWVCLTGAAHIAAALGVLFCIYPRLASTLEAAMLGVFTILVWVPAVVATPTKVGDWSEFLTSWTIAAAAWVVAEGISAQSAKTGFHLRFGERG